MKCTIASCLILLSLNLGATSPHADRIVRPEPNYVRERFIGPRLPYVPAEADIIARREALLARLTHLFTYPMRLDVEESFALQIEVCEVECDQEQRRIFNRFEEAIAVRELPWQRDDVEDLLAEMAPVFAMRNICVDQVREERRLVRAQLMHLLGEMLTHLRR